MLSTVSSALAELKAGKEVTWLLDGGFDDVAVWRTIFEQKEHVVCRASHRDRIVQWRTEAGEWTSGPLEKVAERTKLLAAVRTTMEVRRGKQAHPNKQAVEVEISACTFRITYHSEVRRPSQEKDQILRKELWLVQVQVLDSTLEPWWLITDWPVETEADALRIFYMCRQRWAIEEWFRVEKSELHLESIRLQDLESQNKLLLLVTLACGFLFSLLCPALQRARVCLLRRWCQRSDWRLAQAKLPVYRLRWALSTLWSRYPPRFSACAPYRAPTHLTWPVGSLKWWMTFWNRLDLVREQVC